MQKKIKIQESRCHLLLERDQPDLLQSIVQIAMFGSSVDERRRNSLIGNCRNLNHLTGELKKMGFNLSQRVIIELLHQTMIGL